MIDNPDSAPGGHETVHLAKLLRRDLARCAELEQTLFAGDDPWSEAAFVSELDRGNFYLGAYDTQERLLGYAGLALIGHPPHAEAEIHTIAVDPAHQRRGVGRALLRRLLDKADARQARTFLEVRTDNDAAIALYREYGFEIVGLRKRYYRPSGADAHTMLRPAQSTEEEGGVA